jgi:Tfp pilus assembly protein PilV
MRLYEAILTTMLVGILGLTGYFAFQVSQLQRALEAAEHLIDNAARWAENQALEETRMAERQESEWLQYLAKEQEKEAQADEQTERELDGLLEGGK